MKPLRGRRLGIVLLSSLAVMVVVTMVIAALLKTSRGGLFQASHYRDGLRAEQAARGGANHLLTVLEQDKTFVGTLSGSLGEATYTVTFDPSKPYYSVNNLTGNSEAAAKSFQGHTVAPRSADLIVVGNYGISRRAIRVVAQQGISSLRSVAAVGRVSLSGDVTIDGVKSLLPPSSDPTGPPEPAPGGILSKHKTVSASQPAIAWSGGGNFELSELSRLETAPPMTGTDSVSAPLRALHAERLIDHGAGDMIPDIDVAAKVSQGMSHPPLASGGATLSGYVFVNQARSVDGDLTINGDLVLSKAPLYIDGNLTLNGGVEGIGSLFVSGDIVVNGGNALVQSSQPTGTALLAGGDVRLQGIDAEGYLDSLLGSDPSLSTLRALLNSYEAGGSDMWSLSVSLAKHLGSLPSPNPSDPNFSPPWVSPIPAPDGTHNHGFASGALPAVILRLKSAPGFSASDPRASKVLRALEEMQYFFRHNKHTVRSLDGQLVKEDGTPLVLEPDYTLSLLAGGAVSPSEFFGLHPNNLLTGDGSFGANPYWDDRDLEMRYSTHDRIGWNINHDLHTAKRMAYLRNNPIDFSWLGESSFQGLIYARGDIFADTRFKVIGSLIGLGDVFLHNGATLIFNEEYRSLFGEQLPLGVVYTEEL